MFCSFRWDDNLHINPQTAFSCEYSIAWNMLLAKMPPILIHLRYFHFSDESQYHLECCIDKIVTGLSHKTIVFFVVVAVVVIADFKKKFPLKICYDVVISWPNFDTNDGCFVFKTNCVLCIWLISWALSLLHHHWFFSNKFFALTVMFKANGFQIERVTLLIKTLGSWLIWFIWVTLWYCFDQWYVLLKADTCLLALLQIFRFNCLT